MYLSIRINNNLGLVSYKSELNLNSKLKERSLNIIVFWGLKLPRVCVDILKTMIQRKVPNAKAIETNSVESLKEMAETERSCY